MIPQRVDIIYKGNCARLLLNEKRFPNKSVDLIVTSPPYADKRKNSYGGVSPKKYVEWFLPISEQLYRVLKSRGSFILNIKEHANNGERETYVLDLILKLRKQGWLWVEEYCWYKKNSFPGKWPNRFRDTWERCFHFTKQNNFKMYQNAVKVPIGDWVKSRFKSMSKKDFIRNISKTDSNFGRNVSNWLGKRKVFPHNVLDFENEHYLEATTLLSFATECTNRNHSAVFPLELPSWFIRLLTRKDNIILDPFMGVGTTAIAAKLLGRRYLGIEIMDEYITEARANIRELETS